MGAIKAKLSSYKDAFKSLERLYYSRKALRDELLQTRDKKVAERQETVKKIDLLQEVRILFREASAFAREQARQQIEYMVTRALQYTFGPGLEFKVELTERRGQPEAEFFVVSEYAGVKIKNRPQDARGGGIVDIISLALRITLLETAGPLLSAPVLLDEPGKHVSDEFAPNLGQFLKSVAKDFNRQVILVTHNHYLTEAADLVYQVDIKDGKSVLTRL